MSFTTMPTTMLACMVEIKDDDVRGQLRGLDVFEVRSPDPDSLGDLDVLLKLVGSGACVTNLEIWKGYYGHPPARIEDCLLGANGLPLKGRLATGHEGLYEVLKVGRLVEGIDPGDQGAVTVRPGCGKCRNCLVGHPNKCVSGLDTLVETGIHAAHGSDVEYKIVPMHRFVKAPQGLGMLGILAEPWSICGHSYAEVEPIWRIRNPGLKPEDKPGAAAILGNGPIGQGLAARCKRGGVHPVVIARTPRPCLRGDLAHDLGATYISTIEAGGSENSPLPLRELIPYIRRKHPEIDLAPTGFEWVFEATGSDQIVAEADDIVADGGVVVWTSITGNDRLIQAPVARANLFGVLGNKSRVGVVNAHRDHFGDALETLEYVNRTSPGWCQRLLTHPKQGMQGCKDMLHLLGGPPEDIADLMKTYAVMDN